MPLSEVRFTYGFELVYGQPYVGGMNGMKEFTQFFKTAGWRSFLFFAALFWGSMLYVFYPVLPTDWVMLSPDFPKYYPTFALEQWMERVLAGQIGFAPLNIIKFLGHPLIWQELFFIFSTFFAGLSVFYYLRTQQLSRLAAYGGGLLFAFSGYSFTLFCAGHGGYFYLISCGLFAFGLINRCFQRREAYYFVILGATLIWAELEQPDIWLLFVLLISAYTIWRSVREWRESRSFSFLWRVYPRFLLTVATILLIGSGQIKRALTETLAGRDAQIKETSQSLHGAASGEEKGTVAKEALDRWIFTTNWSLPPEDVAEFVVPGIFGNDSFRPPYPYWGRLGQPYGFVPGGMAPNYRQHTVYLGIVSVLFALFAVLAWWCAGRTPRSPSEAGAVVPQPCYSDVPFWTTVWLACVIVSMGRYTPIYRLVYHIPFMDYLRAPVKFHHLVEFANASLAAYGMEFFLRPSEAGRKLRLRYVWVCCASVLGLFFGMACFQLGAVPIRHHIAALGLASVSETLQAYAVSNLFRSVLIVLGTLACFLWASRSKVAVKGLVGCVCAALVINTLDLAAVARRYVIPVYVGAHYTENPVIKAMLARTGGHPANVMNYVTSNAGEQDWFSTAMELYGFSNVAPNPNERTAPHAVLFQRFQNNPVRYWQILGVRFVLLPRKIVEPFVRQGLLSIVCDFEIGQGIVRVTQPKETSFTLAEFTGGTALPALYANWKGATPADQQLASVLQDEKSGSVIADVASSSDAHGVVLPKSVTFDKMRKMPYALSTRGRIAADVASLLVFNEPFRADLEVSVDGRKACVYQANGLWAAVQVPQGAHEVMLRLKRNWTLNAVSLAVGLIALGWFLVRVCFPSQKQNA